MVIYHKVYETFDTSGGMDDLMSRCVAHGHMKPLIIQKKMCLFLNVSGPL